MILSNIKQFFIKNKKTIIYFGFFIFIFSFSFNNTFAGINGLNADESLLSPGNIVKIINMVVQTVGVLMSVATYLATMFLSPEWINGSLFGLDEKLKGIWILVSNIVYFIFAFILIWIAFMNIIGKTGEMYELKKALPKFIVGVLIVPFSWFLVQFILSISAILTVSAITLPYETFDNYGIKMSEMKIPTDCRINLNEDKKEGDQIINCKFGQLEGDSMTDGILGIFSLYNYGILKFDSYDDINKKFIEESKSGTVLDIVVKLLFSTIFILIYGILIITLAIVLLIRCIYIWIYMMLSPLFGLMYFFGKTDGGEGLAEKFNLKEFIALAMVPVYTLLALSFGLLFIFVTGQGLVKPNTIDGKISLGKLKTDESGDKLGKNGDSYLKIGNRRLLIVGSLSSVSDEDLTKFSNIIEEEGDGLLGIVGNLILKIFGVVVLWGAVMAAMRTSKITKQITEPIYNFGTKVGEIAASSPGNIPIFGGYSMKGMGAAASSIQSTLNTNAAKPGQEFAEKFMKTDDFTKKMNEIRTLTDQKGLKTSMDTLMGLSKDATSTQISAINKMFKKKFDVELDLKTGDTPQSKAIKFQTAIVENSHLEGDKKFNYSGNPEYSNKDKIENKIKGGISAPVPDPFKDDLKVAYATDNITPVRFQLNGETIFIESRDKLKTDSIDNFVEAIKGLSIADTKKKFNSKELDFDKLFIQAQEKLGDEALFEKDGKIDIDLTKKI